MVLYIQIMKNHVIELPWMPVPIRNPGATINSNRTLREPWMVTCGSIMNLKLRNLDGRFGAHDLYDLKFENQNTKTIL